MCISSSYVVIPLGMQLLLWVPTQRQNPSFSVVPPPGVHRNPRVLPFWSVVQFWGSLPHNHGWASVLCLIYAGFLTLVLQAGLEKMCRELAFISTDPT